MLVDDHPEFRQVVRALLQEGGAEFVECENGGQAVEEYPRFGPDVVLMDIAMQGLDGLQATAQIKTRFPDARVYILTQYDDVDLRDAARQAGACRYLLKDDLSQLKALLQLPAAMPGPHSPPRPWVNPGSP